MIILKHPSGGRGFTLMELLVVLGILGFLLGLLLIVVGRARSAIRSTQCFSHLRDWGQATALYAAEYDDRLPPDGAPNGTSRHAGWYVDLPRMLDLPPYGDHTWRTNAGALPETSSPWRCPSNTRVSNGRNLFHYCLNGRVNGSGTGRQTLLSSIRFPESTVWLFDNGKLAAVARQNNVHTNLHQGGAQFLFLDGHARRFKRSDYWDEKRNVGRTHHPELHWEP